MPPTPDLIFIFVLFLLLFGPDRLPEVARMVAKGVREVRKASHEFKRQLNLFDDENLQ